MATIKKPAKKMQEGGNIKIKVKIKPDRKLTRQAREDKAFNVKNAEDALKAKIAPKVDRSYGLDKAVKEAGFEAKQQKMGGVTKKAKKGGSFPDLNKDGKITKADILKGRGVIAKKGAKLKKAQSGASFKNITDMFGRTGGFDGGMRNQMAASILKKKKAAAAPTTATMKKGGKMKKCAYGCK